MKKMLEKYVAFHFNHHKRIRVVFIIMMVIAIIGVIQIRINSDMTLFRAKDSTYAVQMDRLSSQFPTNQMTLLLGFEKGEFSVDDMLAILGTMQKASKLKSFDTLVMPAVNPLEMISNLRDSDLTMQEQVIELVDLNLSFLPFYLYEDSIYFRLDLPLSDTLDMDDQKALENHLNKLDLTYKIMGDDYMQNKLFDYIRQILSFLPLVALGGIFLVFSWQMGSVKATVLSIMPAGIAALWTMACIGYLSDGVSIITVLSPIFTIVIGSADGLHFISHYQEALIKEDQKEKALVKTLEMVGMPMVVTTLTSAVGFWSLYVIGEPIISDLATFAALGILLAGLVTWLVLPMIIASGVRIKPAVTRNEALLVVLEKLWGKRIIAITLVLLVFSAVLVPSIKTEFSQLMFYKESTDLYKNFDTVMKVTGGSVPLFVLARPDPDQNPLEVSMKLEASLMNLPQVSKVMGMATLSSQLNQIQDEEIPMLEIFKSLASKSKNQMQASDGTIRIVVFPKDLDNGTLDVIEKTLRSDDLAAYHPQITGVQYLMKDLNHQVVSQQLTTQLMALMIILCLLWIAIRSLRAAVLSLVPIVVTMVLMYAFLVLTGISLNLFSVLMFSISIGIGIDYAIHFTSVWSVYRREGKAMDLALDAAYRYTSRPIVANALGLAIGMSALLFSPLMIHTYLSVIMWFTMLVAASLTLTLLPTLLKLLKKP